MTAKTLYIGDGSGDTVTIEFDIGDGAGSNPAVRYNSTTGQVEISADGTNFIILANTGGGVGSMPFYNNSGAQLDSGDLVYPSAYNDTAGLYEAELAIATEANSTTKYATMIVDKDTANETSGILVERKIITDVDTDGGVVGRPIYLDTTGGGWRISLPDLENRVQIVGQIIEVHATTGRIMLKPNALLWRTQADEI
jgi:hypothetical protein